MALVQDKLMDEILGGLAFRRGGTRVSSALSTYGQERLCRPRCGTPAAKRQAHFEINGIKIRLEARGSRGSISFSAAHPDDEADRRHGQGDANHLHEENAPPLEDVQREREFLRYFGRDAEKLLAMADADKLRLVTTEKDFARLAGRTGILGKLRDRLEPFHVILEFENPTAIGEMIDEAVRKAALAQTA